MRVIPNETPDPILAEDNWWEHVRRVGDSLPHGHTQTQSDIRSECISATYNLRSRGASS